MLNLKYYFSASALTHFYPKFKMKISLTILMAFILNAEASIDIPADNWVLEKDKDNIKVWTLETETSSIKSFKAVTSINASVTQLAAVLKDIEAYPQWMSNIGTTEVLEAINENECYYYFEVEAPWPVSNRDNIVHFKLTKNYETKGFKVYVTGEADYIAENQDIVRIPKSIGTWQFIPLEEEKTEVVFEYAADPGGKLPAWVINIFIIDGPFKTLSNLKEFVKREKYQL